MEIKPGDSSVKNPQSKKQSLTVENICVAPPTIETTELSGFSKKNPPAKMNPKHKPETHIIDETEDMSHDSAQSDFSGRSMHMPPLTPSHTQTPSNVHRPGERLRQARLQKKREIKDIAADLHISERVLIAIEADDYKSLPEPAFIRGYLRAYGRLLGIDSDILILQFNEIYTSATGLSSNHSLENSPLQRLAKLSSRKRKSKRWVLLMLIFVTVTLILILIPSIKSSLSSAGVVVISTLGLPHDIPTKSTIDSTSLTAANPSTLTAITPAAVQTQSDQLVFTLSKPSDVNVEDSTGKTLFTGTAATAKPLILNGVSPFNIRITDASGVNLALNSERVDLRPFAVNGFASFRLSR